jgi:flagellar hook-length control protein FliK
MTRAARELAARERQSGGVTPGAEPFRRAVTHAVTTLEQARPGARPRPERPAPPVEAPALDTDRPVRLTRRAATRAAALRRPAPVQRPDHAIEPDPGESGVRRSEVARPSTGSAAAATTHPTQVAATAEPGATVTGTAVGDGTTPVDPVISRAAPAETPVAEAPVAEASVAQTSVAQTPVAQTPVAVSAVATSTATVATVASSPTASVAPTATAVGSTVPVTAVSPAAGAGAAAVTDTDAAAAPPLTGPAPATATAASRTVAAAPVVAGPTAPTAPTAPAAPAAPTANATDSALAATAAASAAAKPVGETAVEPGAASREGDTLAATAADVTISGEGVTDGTGADAGGPGTQTTPAAAEDTPVGEQVPPGAVEPATPEALIAPRDASTPTPIAQPGASTAAGGIVPVSASANAPAPAVLPTAPTAATPTPVPAPAPTPAAQLAPQLVTLARTSRGSQRMVVRLTPEHLGPVELRVDVGREGVNIRLTGMHEATREALRASLGDLRRELEDGGLADVGLDVASDAGTFTDTGARDEPPSRTPLRPYERHRADGGDPAQRPSSGADAGAGASTRLVDFLA